MTFTNHNDGENAFWTVPSDKCLVLFTSKILNCLTKFHSFMSFCQYFASWLDWIDLVIKFKRNCSILSNSCLAPKIFWWYISMTFSTHQKLYKWEAWWLIWMHSCLHKHACLHVHAHMQKRHIYACLHTHFLQCSGPHDTELYFSISPPRKVPVPAAARSKALRTRSYSKETELVSDSNHQLITTWLVTRFRTRSYSKLTE